MATGENRHLDLCGSAHQRLIFHFCQVMDLGEAEPITVLVFQQTGAKFSIFLTLSPSKIAWKSLLGNCPCPELAPKLSLSITWQRATLPGPKHTKHEVGDPSHVLMGSMVGFQSPEMLAATTLFTSRGFV